MTSIVDALSEAELPIIEVPAELRGLSDEEIIKHSQKEIREVSGKRKKGERRPGKRIRMALKEEKAHQEAAAIFGKLENLPTDKQEMVKHAFTEKSLGYSTFNFETFDNTHTASQPKTAYKANSPKEALATEASTETSTVTPAAAPSTSGRVLKASFGAKIGEKPKAVIVSAADLALQKAEERAKKIREALFAKRNGSTTGLASASPASTLEGQPPKRPRGRPRKNPLPEA